MERKYSFEAGLNVFTSYKTIIPVEVFRELKETDLHRYHIYGILSYNQVFFRKEKIKVTEDGIKIAFFMIKDGKEIDYELPLIKVCEGLDYHKIHIEILYPAINMVVSITDEDFLKKNPQIQKNIEISAQDFFMIVSKILVSRLEYEVLYIGQAYGKDGSRTAFDRLESHSTLQKILEEYSGHYADKHIYILLLEMQSSLAMSFDGISQNFTKSEEESSKHLTEVCSDLPQENQIINIAEAAMINYFKPAYNVNFVENFPNENHKGYRQYFDLDYNALTVEIDLDFPDAPNIQLYTEQNRIANSFDFIRYKLFNDDNRQSMYDVFQKN
ncbi:hypothetical protein [Anaerostipes sp. MSJ-23]|uniref:hypothetical protein n=1 Tax=Anaerostipes sp. MSJ-23 TaxID=2841520 RepID=UPI001C121AA9|nr:hypothetical protein [Anaerostipes sp. MSJ-23]MBU5461083.1 hypothetical protein [Anaerostipes sp. MSJ-23]